ncbi:MAG: ABC transporter ATP-binding protein [Endomicrobiia bacterium]
MNNSLNIVSLQNVYKKYPDSIDWVIKDVSVDIEKKKLIFICGPSGVGKSTLLHIIGLMDSVDKGSVYFLGEKIIFNGKDLSKLRLENVGFMFQYHYLIENLTVKENILLPLWVKNKKVFFELDDYIKQYLIILDIEKLLERYPYELSGGEQQRVALARALVNNPKLVVADEPTGNLDQENAKKIVMLMKDFTEKFDMTFVVATHNLELTKFADKVINLKDGKIASIEV